MTHPKKVALITGASAGIGQAMAQRLARDGTSVIIADVSDGAETLALVREAGGEGLFISCDVSKPEDVARLASRVAASLGRVDILVNNAGIYPMQSFEQMEFSDWRRVLAVNLDSAFLLSKAFYPQMKQNNWGRIVNLASTTFHLSTPTPPHYVASKGGVIGFTRALASQLGGFGITVNALAPGLTKTPGTEEFHDRRVADVTAVRSIPRAAVAQDLANALAFLVSDDASFITGQTLNVDGGQIRT